jgi:hypothetical protein
MKKRFMHDVMSASFISPFKVNEMLQSWHSRSSLTFCQSFHILHLFGTSYSAFTPLSRTSKGGETIKYKHKCLYKYGLFESSHLGIEKFLFPKKPKDSCSLLSFYFSRNSKATLKTFPGRYYYFDWSYKNVTFAKTNLNFGIILPQEI